MLKKSFAVLNGDHVAGRPDGTRHCHGNAGFSLGEGRWDRRQTDWPGLVEGRPPTSGQERRQRIAAPTVDLTHRRRRLSRRGSRGPFRRDGLDWGSPEDNRTGAHRGEGDEPKKNPLDNFQRPDTRRREVNTRTHTRTTTTCDATVGQRSRSRWFQRHHWGEDCMF